MWLIWAFDHLVGCCAGVDVSVAQSAPKSPSPLLRLHEDLQTRNSSGAESSAHVVAADVQEKAGGQSKADGTERVFSDRAAGGVEVGSEAVNAHDRARSPLSESELQRARFSGGPPMHKEMADAMVARAGDWSGIHALSISPRFVLPCTGCILQGEVCWLVFAAAEA